MFRRISAREVKDIALAVLFTLGIIWMLWLIWGLIGKEEIARKAAATAHTQLTSLEDRKATIQGDLDTLSTPRGKDAAIRTAFGVAKPGEEVIIVVPAATSAPTSTPQTWWQWLFGWL